MHHDLPHWNYFRLLERDLEESFRYVQPCEAHFPVYSDYFARIILTACAEIENCLHAFAAQVSESSKPQFIGQFQKLVAAKYPQFMSMKIDMPRFSLRLEPWEGWSEHAAPDWWTNGYNKIKHDRLQHPDAPTMWRATEAVAGLLVLLLHFYRLKYGKCQLPTTIAPTLLLPYEKSADGVYAASMGWCWELPGEGEEQSE